MAEDLLVGLKSLGEVTLNHRDRNLKGVVHGDLKPDNVARERYTDRVKIIDFGNSCFAGRTAYAYVQSRFYRSPEVILGLQFGTPIESDPADPASPSAISFSFGSNICFC